MNVYARIAPYLRPHRMRFIQACVAMLGVAVFNGGSLYLVKPIVDNVFILIVPGAMETGLGYFLFWWSLGT